MKKKTPIKKAATTSRRSTKKAGTGGTILIHRIVIVSACLTLVVAGVLFFNKQAVTKSVAGASIVNGLFMQATVPVPHDIAEATAYNIYYKQTHEKDFTNAARDISPTVGSYTISHLKKGVDYEYRFAALDENGKEFMFSEILPLTNLQSM